MSSLDAAGGTTPSSKASRVTTPHPGRADETGLPPCRTREGISRGPEGGRGDGTSLIIRIGDDDLGPLRRMISMSRSTASSRGAFAKFVRIGVGFGVGHARIAISEHHDLVVADDVGCRRQFLHPDGMEVVANFGSVHGRVEDLALLAAGATHQHRAHSRGLIASHSARRPWTPHRRGEHEPSAGRDRNPWPGTYPPSSPEPHVRARSHCRLELHLAVVVLVDQSPATNGGQQPRGPRPDRWR